MATTTIPWGDGSGDNIYLTYSSASGDQTVEVSSDANTGIARSKVVTFTSGVGNITQQLTVNQEAGVSLVFYSYIVFDGVAYIDTDIHPDNNSTYRVTLGLETLEAAQRIFLVDSDNSVYCGVVHGSSSNSTNRQIAPFYNSAALSANQLQQVYPMYSYFLTPKGQGWGDTYYTFTKGNSAPNGNLILGSYHNHTGQPYSGAMGAFSIYGSDAQDAVSNSELNNFTRTVYLRPCKYNGESGFWNVDEGKFYGNSAGSGNLIAANATTKSPSSYDSNHSYYRLDNPSNAYASYSSTTYSIAIMTRGSGAETYVYFKFDTSSIPEDATILRVFCSVGAAKSSTNTNVINTATIQLCSGTSAKGTAKSITSTSRTVYKIDCGTWTRQELEDARLKIYGKRGTSNVNTNHNLYLYGASLYILYTD